MPPSAAAPHRSQRSSSSRSIASSVIPKRPATNSGRRSAVASRSDTTVVNGSSSAHSTLVLDDTNSTAILADGALGKGVASVPVERSEDNDSTRVEASHDGYLKGFGLLHQRTLILGNDGKELRGLDRIVAKGRRKIREAAAYAVRFHLAPGVEATATADGMGAILRSPGAPPWNFRCRGAMLTVEESLVVDGTGTPRQAAQLVIVGEVSGLGGEIAWQLRRSS